MLEFVLWITLSFIVKICNRKIKKISKSKIEFQILFINIFNSIGIKLLPLKVNFLKPIILILKKSIIHSCLLLLFLNYKSSKNSNHGNNQSNISKFSPTIRSVIRHPNSYLNLPFITVWKKSYQEAGIKIFKYNYKIWRELTFKNSKNLHSWFENII